MGESFNIARQLDPPFDFIDERVIYIPPRRQLEVKNNDLKLILFIEGELDLLIDRRLIGHVEPGDILLVPRRCRQAYVPRGPTEERLHVIRLFFDPNGLGLDLVNTEGPARQRDPEANFSLFVRTYLRATHLLKGGQNEAIRQLIRLIRREITVGDTGFRYRVSAYCRILATEIVRQAGWSRAATPAATAAAAAVPAGETWVVAHTKEFLTERFDRPLTLADIAAEVRLTPEHLARRFKQQTGQTVFEFLRDLRIESSTALLLSSKLRIGEIAHRTGFSSCAVFCRNFQRLKGCSPLAFRQKGTARLSFQTTTLLPDPGDI